MGNTNILVGFQRVKINLVWPEAFCWKWCSRFPSLWISNKNYAFWNNMYLLLGASEIVAYHNDSYLSHFEKFILSLATYKMIFPPFCGLCLLWGLDTSAPSTSAPFGKNTSAPCQDTSAPGEKTLRSLTKDTSAPC